MIGENSMLLIVVYSLWALQEKDRWWWRRRQRLWPVYITSVYHDTVLSTKSLNLPTVSTLLYWFSSCYIINISSVYSSFYNFTELLQSTCAIAALGLIPPRLGYVCDHLRRPISGCGGWERTSAIMLSLPPVLDAETVSLLLFVLLTQWTHLKCSLKPTYSLWLILSSCLWGALVAVWPRYCAI